MSGAGSGAANRRLGTGRFYGEPLFNKIVKNEMAMARGSCFHRRIDK
jgi:hypothetical protein